jgi:hypothetical protein
MELVNKCRNCQNETLWTILIDHIEQANVYRTVILTASITIVAGLITFGISYGELKNQVKSLSEQMNRIERNIPYAQKKG